MVHLYSKRRYGGKGKFLEAEELPDSGPNGLIAIIPPSQSKIDQFGYAPLMPRMFMTRQAGIWTPYHTILAEEVT